jgi:hypothetical protein
MHWDVAAAPTWLMSCTCPVMRATWLLLVEGVHRNMVWSSLPLTRRSGCPFTTASYRCCATCGTQKLRQSSCQVRAKVSAIVSGPCSCHDSHFWLEPGIASQAPQYYAKSLAQLSECVL